MFNSLTIHWIHLNTEECKCRYSDPWSWGLIDLIGWFVLLGSPFSRDAKTILGSLAPQPGMQTSREIHGNPPIDGGFWWGNYGKPEGNWGAWWYPMCEGVIYGHIYHPCPLQQSSPKHPSTPPNMTQIKWRGLIIKTRRGSKGGYQQQSSQYPSSPCRYDLVIYFFKQS